MNDIDRGTPSNIGKQVYLDYSDNPHGPVERLIGEPDSKWLCDNGHGPKFIEPQKNVLQEAEGLIFGEREGDYGHPKINLQNIAVLWSSFLDARPGGSGRDADDCHNLTESEVAILMLLLKVARMIPAASYNGIKRDSVVDAAGYLGLIERVEGLK